MCMSAHVCRKWVGGGDSGVGVCISVGICVFVLSYLSVYVCARAFVCM